MTDKTHRGVDLIKEQERNWEELMKDKAQEELIRKAQKEPAKEERSEDPRAPAFTWLRVGRHGLQRVTSLEVTSNRWALCDHFLDLSRAQRLVCVELPEVDYTVVGDSATHTVTLSLEEYQDLMRQIVGARHD